MNIWFITKSNYSSDFQYGRTVELPKSLVGLNHHVGLVSACYTNRVPPLRVEVYDHIRLIPIGHSTFFMGIIYVVKLFFVLFSSLFSGAKRPDVIITDISSVYPSLLFAILSRLKVLPVKFVLDIRSVPVETTGILAFFKKLEYSLAIWLAKYTFDGITVITLPLRDDIASRFRIPCDEIGVWCSGASLDTFDPSKAVMPEDAGFLKGKFVVMHHGGFNRFRGQQQSMEAIELLYKEYPDIILFFLGSGSTVAEFKDSIASKGLEKHIYIHDAVPYEKVRDYLALADVGLIALPNWDWWRVSSPQKLMEYLAMGKPVIASDIPAHRNVLQDNACAIYLSSIEPAEIARAIRYAYSRKGELARMGIIGRELIEQEYSWNAQAQRLTDYLVNVCHRQISLSRN